MPTAVSKYHPRRAGCTVRQEWKRRFAHTIDHLRRSACLQRKKTVERETRGCPSPASKDLQRPKAVFSILTTSHSPTPDRRARFSLADPPTSRPHPEP
ncbi:hypothetical protein MCOR02_009254 [Pyricularia oryzae]|uniref:Uncharacterized protein n=1 Tax=Pyricularia oryzae TaxID=318829 RepID=A0A4P7NB55_PYROR|nr:hypothetical protein MCOR02_009254 [Pyricularia oryzae]KAI6307856.1 hypothetical protein MCOR34_007420 [Pyricularia oryzae]KAI6392691.1 hypothetical protein MCOR20_011054 [Pyricularia oryzae]KAI6448535.1 hypothetical protein MCOR22_002791 [Pyricularia oryzae]KAI6469945.1 hypothetical protein MCOR17_003674 [Pyricularia oryzae]